MANDIYENEAFTNKAFHIAAAKEMERIIANKLGTVGQIRDIMMKSANIQDLHRTLKSCVLPGDMEKLAEMEGEYDLSGIEEQLAKVQEEEEPLEEEDNLEPIKTALERLEKIASDLGEKGNHEQALMVDNLVAEINDKIN